MRVINVADKFTVVVGDKTAEPKFRKALSKLIIEKYGKDYYDKDVVTNILYSCRDYYITEFEKILNKEVSYTFYREIIWLHEQATDLRQSEHFNNLPKDIDKSYVAKYRRILKMIIEQGCNVEMVTTEKRDSQFRKRVENILDDLIFLGSIIILCAESLAEQIMIGDSMEIIFDKSNLYVFRRKHYYDFVFKHLYNKQEDKSDDYIIDNNGYEDFKDAVANSFNIDYEKIWHTIILLMEKFNLEKGDCISFERTGFLKDIQAYTESQPELIENFLSGLTLKSDNKMPLVELAKRPHSLNRSLYRPMLLWKINNKEYYVFGIHSLYEAQNNLYLNAIPWKNSPIEWADTPNFKNYVDRKHDTHDKWLDDVVENNIKETGLKYQRRVKKLSTKNKTYSLEKESLGEIDFIIIATNLKKVFVADCKHLLGRYDMVNQKNDFDHFTEDGKHKSYNTRINLKVKWLKENKNILEEHFQLKYNDPNLSLKEYSVEGIFFINTPTFYMYNSDLRIYTYNQVIDVITGKHVDPIFTYYVDDEDKEIFYSVKYPYFRKPKMVYYENEDDDCDVDKYGFPIKK